MTTKEILEVLEPEQLASAKREQHLGRLRLGRGTLLVLWALRLYVLLMVFIITYTIWQALHA